MRRKRTSAELPDRGDWLVSELGEWGLERRRTAPLREQDGEAGEADPPAPPPERDAA